MNFTQFEQYWDMLDVGSPLTGSPWTTGTWLAMGSTAVLAYAVWEQVKFAMWRQGKSQPVPGPSMVPPIVGGIVEMVKDPYGFWEKQRLYSPNFLSWNSIVGVFTVFVTDAALCRHIFNTNSSDTLLMVLHPSGKNILGDKNIAFMHGPDHKVLRKSFLALFTRRAMGVYVRKQDVIIRNHLAEWVEHIKKHGVTELRPFIRDLNAYTSQDVFVGPYLDDPVEREKFSAAYRAMTDGFLAFPLCVPGTAVWRGRQGRFFILKVLTKAAQRSKDRMAAGHEPDCLLDFWSLQVLEDIKTAKDNGEPEPFYAENHKMADSVMDFLFASQDASTASLCTIVAQMAEHPDVLEKVREEQNRMRPDINKIIEGDLLNEMEYTRQVVRETLRWQPPAPMVPQMAQKAFKISDDYTCPKGTLVIPSIVAACQQGYAEPTKFDPDRFGPERKEDQKYAGNFLVFGHGPHYCVGKEYAVNHLMCFLAILASAVDLKRTYTPESHTIKYLPTLYPGDTLFELSYRKGYVPPPVKASNGAAH